MGGEVLLDWRESAGTGQKRDEKANLRIFTDLSIFVDVFWSFLEVDRGNVGSQWNTSRLAYPSAWQSLFFPILVDLLK